MDKEKQIEINCNNCKRQHTKYCPNSSECSSLPNLPYFETDVIRLLEHDWDMHEKKIYELEAENRTLKDRIYALEIDQSQFEELEKQLAIYKRALEIQIGNQMQTQRLLSPTAADISYIIKCRIQQAEKELEGQD